MPKGTLVVDACCWIDLFASGRIEELAATLPYSLAAPRYVVEEEVLTIAPHAGREERCDFGPLLRAGLVSVWEIETPEEKRELVRFATVLEDGEAAVCALAIVRGCAVATDDRKAIRTLIRWAPQITILQTPELLHAGAEVTAPDPNLLREVLHAVETKARFRPRFDAPFAEWWAAGSRRP